jgi:hypothetical protein
VQTGSFFTIGTTHVICEDYALCGKDYAIISDGCSNGGGGRINTDWGSRFLCKAAEEQLLRIANAQQNAGDEVAALLADDPNALFRQIITTANVQRRLFPRLEPECLTATLGLIFPFKLGLRAILAGDGVIVGKRRDGSFDIYQLEFEAGGECNNSAPFYPRYLIDPASFNQYIKLFGGCLKITNYTGVWGEMQKSVSWQDTQFNNFVFCRSFPISEYEYVLVGSDGLSSFYEIIQNETSKRKSMLELLEVLKVVLDFPDYGVNFAERQGQWIFKQNKPNCFHRLGWSNGDDVSFGVVYCGDTT